MCGSSGTGGGSSHGRRVEQDVRASRSMPGHRWSGPPRRTSAGRAGHPRQTFSIRGASPHLKVWPGSGQIVGSNAPRRTGEDGRRFQLTVHLHLMSRISMRPVRLLAACIFACSDARIVVPASANYLFWGELRCVRSVRQAFRVLERTSTRTNPSCAPTRGVDGFLNRHYRVRIDCERRCFGHSNLVAVRARILTAGVSSTVAGSVSGGPPD